MLSLDICCFAWGTCVTYIKKGEARGVISCATSTVIPSSSSSAPLSPPVGWLLLLLYSLSIVKFVLFRVRGVIVSCLYIKVKRGVISWAASMAINPEDQVEEGEEDEEDDDEEEGGHRRRHHSDVQQQ